MFDNKLSKIKPSEISKFVIVLGNEKEGIPVDIIQLLDVCVKIPQTGLIRSLNVYLTGTIMIWEYI